MTQRTTASSLTPISRCHRYWAFISYSWDDEDQARSLHRRLENYSIPRSVRQELPDEVPSVRRLRPVFRDDDEMPASGVLDDRLRAALDESRALIVVASPTAAASPYVNYEVDHFVGTRGTDRVVIIVVDGEPNGLPGREPMPAALRRSGLLWVDCRLRRGLDRRRFLRIVADVLGVDFDTLWRRDVRRRRRRIVSWVAGTVVLIAMMGGIFWQQQRIAEEQQHSAEQRTPQQQRIAFESFLRAELLESNRELIPGFEPADLDFEILRSDDLNGDGLTDYFVHNTTPAFCGSGGCALEVYMTTAPGEYTMPFALLGSSTPRTRDVGADGVKDILTTNNWISGQPLYTVYRWNGRTYELAHYEFCDGVVPEACDPLIITPVNPSSELLIAPDAVFRERPDANSRPVTVGAGGSEVDPSSPSIIGVLPNGEWYLVNVWKGSSGFVEAQAIES